MYYYCIDPAKRAKYNAAGYNYTPAYIPELLLFLGVTAKEIRPDGCRALAPDDVLFANVNDLPCTPSCRCVLFSGDEKTAVRAIADWYLLPDGRRVPLFASVADLPDAKNPGSVLRKKEDGTPLLVREGAVYRFTFDLPASVWYSEDGVYTGEPQHGFFIGRTPDTRPLPPDMPSPFPYNDALLFEIEDILHGWNVPALYRLPPDEAGQVPDLALHFSGDDDCTDRGFDRNAAEVMARLGLPYHINLMPAGGVAFVIDRADYRYIQSIGTEFGLHTDFTLVSYSAESQEAQAKLYSDTFGERPVTNTNHCFIQGGEECERLRRLGDSGMIADNGKLGEVDPNDINAFNISGFSFGTSFPRFALDDAAHGNKVLPAMEIPINYYEPRLGGRYPAADSLHVYLDGAAAEGRVADFFLHPHYLAPENPDTPLSLEALREILAYCEAKHYTVLRSTTNRIAAFWQARRNSSVQCAKDGSMTVDAAAALVFAVPGKCSFTVDEKPVCGCEKTLHGKTYTLLSLTGGRHEIRKN